MLALLRKRGPLPCSAEVFGFGEQVVTSILSGIAADMNGNFVYISDNSMLATVFINSVANMRCEVSNEYTIEINGVKVHQGNTIRVQQSQDYVVNLSVPRSATTTTLDGVKIKIVVQPLSSGSVDDEGESSGESHKGSGESTDDDNNNEEGGDKTGWTWSKTIVPRRAQRCFLSCLTT